MYYVYVLKSLVHNWHYIGHAKEPEERLQTHNCGKVRATKAHLPYRIIYTEEYRTRSEAQKREYYLKRGKFLVKKQAQAKRSLVKWVLPKGLLVRRNPTLSTPLRCATRRRLIYVRFAKNLM